MKVKLLGVMVLTGLALCGGAVAEPSGPHESLMPPAATTRPTTQPRVGMMDPPRGPGMGRGRFIFPFQQDKLTPQQISDAEAFVNANSPNHFRVYQKSERFPEYHERLQWSIVRGHLDLQILQNEDPELYVMKLDQIKLQDKIFGIVSAAREAPAALDRQKIRDELRPLEHDLLEKRKDEARHRLERMQRVVEGEKQRLASMDAASSSGIDEMIDRDIESNGRMLAPFGFGRGGPGRVERDR